MKFPILCLLIALTQLTGCAYSNIGRGYSYLDDDNIREALPLFEKAAIEENSKEAAIMASFLYMNDFQVPLNLAKAEEFYLLAEELDGGYYSQIDQYFMPLAKARILIHDDDDENDAEAMKLIRADRYATYAPVLRMLGKAYAFGKGVDQNLAVSARLYERAMEYDSTDYSLISYSWWLSAHPAVEYRRPQYAVQLMEEIVPDYQDEGVRNRSYVFDGYAGALAANGRYGDAIINQQKAIEYLNQERADYPDFAERLSWYECRLQNYKKNKPWHMTENQTPYVGSAGIDFCVPETVANNQ